MVELIFEEPGINIKTSNHTKEWILFWEIFFQFGVFIFFVLFHFLDEIFERTIDFFDFELYFEVGFVGF